MDPAPLTNDRLGILGISMLDGDFEAGDRLPDGRFVGYVNEPFMLVTERVDALGHKTSWVQTGPGAQIFPVRRTSNRRWMIGLLVQGDRYDAVGPGNPKPVIKALGGYVKSGESALACVERHAMEKVGLKVGHAELFVLPRFLPIGVVDVPILNFATSSFLAGAAPGRKDCKLKFFLLSEAVKMANSNQLFDAATADGVHKVAGALKEHYKRMTAT